MEPIIDAHGHLGDILEPGGGRLIDAVGVAPRRGFDLVALAEAGLHRDPLRITARVYHRLTGCFTRVERARNAAATLENFRCSLDEVGFTHAVCLPIPPYLTFDDLRRAAAAEPRILPFTGVDYRAGTASGFDFEADVRQGARGLKLHPIIQKIPLTSPETRAAVESFAPHGLPVLFHCGVSSYYLGSERSREQPEYGAIHYAAELVRDFPGVRFIAGHAGLFEVDRVIALLGGCRNVWVETSFQSVRRVRELLAVFGPDRVLMGSDWPFGRRPPALEIVRRACAGDAALERRILFENAAELLGVSERP